MVDYSGTGVLAPGAHDTLTVTFLPVTAAVASGVVLIHSNAVAGDTLLHVFGRGVDSTAAIFGGESGKPLPTAFALSAQPNPFNPATQLAFDLPQAARVTLAVYDVTGRLVRTLVDAPYAAGRYTVPFDGGTLPSGVYLARCDAGSVSLTRKLVLLK